MQAPDSFQNPASPFRPGAFWFWHHIPTPAEINAHLAEIARSGLGTIMIQARLGLPLTDYLSQAWLDACSIAAAEATRLGLTVEIYDEYNWMSGHGGGRTVEGADQLRERHLFWLAVPASGGRAIFRDIRSPWLEFLGAEGLNWCYEGGAPLWDEWKIVTVAGDGKDGAIIDLTPQARIAESNESACIVEIASDIPVTIFVSARCRSSRLINYLVPEAAQRFAEKVYAPLLEATRGIARGIFFDHPYAGFYRWQDMAGDLGNSLLWDDLLPAELGDEPLAIQLAALVGDVGSATPALRARFFTAYANRLHEAFFGTLREWCDRRGMAFSGHELLTHVGAWGLHDGLSGIDPRSMPGVDYFGVDRYRSATSVDAADYHPQLAAKLGDSVARANGRSRCTLEQYSTGREIGMPGGAGQWGLSLERLRAQAIRHTLQGGRRIILHALYLTDGFAPGEKPGANSRFDFPPGFNFQPWWQDAPPVLDEIARLSAFLEEGAPIRSVALLYPLETIRVEGPKSECGRHFGLWAEALTLAGIGFDVIDESGLLAADLHDGELVSSSGRYATLIMPAITTLAGPRTATMVEGFVASGGQLLTSGALPRQTRETGRDETLAARFSAMSQQLDAKAISAAVDSLPAPLIRFEHGRTFTTATRTNDAIRFAVFNDRSEQRVALLALPHAPADLIRWHPESGSLSVLAQGLSGTVRMEIAAHSVLCVEIRPGSVAKSLQHHTPPTLPCAKPLAHGWSFSAGGPFQPIATDRGWESQGFSRFAGTGIYRCKVELPPLEDGAQWCLVCPDLAGTAECLIDGRLTGLHVAGEPAFPVGREGQVTVELRIRNSAANRYYPGTIYEAAAGQPSGLTRPPRLEARTADMAADIRILT